MNIYNRLSDTSKKKFVVLIDPDKPSDEQIIDIVKKSVQPVYLFRRRALQVKLFSLQVPPEIDVN